MTNVTGLRLFYFPFEGRISPTRDALRIGGIDYEDVNIPIEEFRERREAGEFPFGALPVIEVETDTGTQRIAQSNAMLRFAGRLSGLYPADDVLQSLKVDEALDMAEDINNLLGPSFHEQDMDRKMAMRKVLAEETLPCWMDYLDRLLQANGGTGYAVGDTLSVADLKFYWMLDFLTNGNLDGIPTTLLDDYATVSAYRTNVTKVRDERLAEAESR